MKHRVLLPVLLSLLVLALTVARLPAALLDGALAKASGGTLRLADSHGTLWRGQGMLATPDGRGQLHALRAIGWQLQASASPLGLVLELEEHGQRQARVRLGPAGVSVEALAIEMPLAALAAGINHPVARAGWRGQLQLASQGLGCDWQQTCEGALRLRWLDAGLDIVPGRGLGSHDVLLKALGQRFEISVATLEGALRVSGNGMVDINGQGRFEGAIDGDPDIVDRIPNVMDQNARASGTRGRVLISLP